MLAAAGTAGAQGVQSAVLTNPTYVFYPDANPFVNAVYACGLPGEPCDAATLKKQADHLCRNPTVPAHWVRTGGPDDRYLGASSDDLAFAPVGADQPWVGHRFRGLDLSGKGTQFGPVQAFTRVTCRNSSLAAREDVRARFAVTATRRFLPRTDRQGSLQLVRLNARGVFTAVASFADGRVMRIRQRGAAGSRCGRGGAAGTRGPYAWRTSSAAAATGHAPSGLWSRAWCG